MSILSCKKIKNPGVYRLINNANKKSYVGKSSNMENRINQHYYDLERGYHPNKKLQSDYFKYGKNNFSVEYIFIVYDENSKNFRRDISDIEKQVVIQEKQNLYNEVVFKTEKKDLKQKTLKTKMDNFESFLEKEIEDAEKNKHVYTGLFDDFDPLEFKIRIKTLEKIKEEFNKIKNEV